MGMHKGMIGKSEGGASVPKEKSIAKKYAEQKLADDMKMFYTMEHTLTDYIQRKTRHDAFEQVNKENKMTFEEWYSTAPNGPWSWQFGVKEFKECMEACWKAAQENK